MTNEGYPTIAGVRNIFNRDGQICFELPSGFAISEVRFDGDGPYSTTITGNVATIKVGYTHAMIDLRYTTVDRKGRIEFGTVRKLNNWNRLEFRAEPEPSGRLSFYVNENGVTRDPAIYLIKNTTEQVNGGNAGQPR